MNNHFESSSYKPDHRGSLKQDVISHANKAYDQMYGQDGSARSRPTASQEATNKERIRALAAWSHSELKTAVGRQPVHEISASFSEYENPGGVPPTVFFDLWAKYGLRSTGGGTGHLLAPPAVRLAGVNDGDSTAAASSAQ